MNIESKCVSTEVSEYLNFGWEHTEDVEKRYGRTSHTEHVLVRDKGMPNYDLLKAYEEKYFNLKSQKRVYQEAEASTVILLFFLLIIPMVIYLAYKSKQKSDIAENNLYLDKEMKKVVEEAKELL
jgi:hypothetical protein